MCAAFSLGEPRACALLGGTRNRNYRLATTRGEFVVRDRYAGYRDAARIALAYRLRTVCPSQFGEASENP